MKEAPESRKLAWFLLILVLLLASVPRFFSVYRTAAFETIPRDPYETYMLHLAGDEGGKVPGSPHVYRILAVAAALPAYWTLPAYRFSRLPDVDPSLLRARQAMAVVSHLAMLGTCALLFFTARRRFAAGVLTALLAAVAGYGVLEGTQMMAVDTLAVFWISLLAFTQNRPAIFASLLLVSCGFNEKIPLIFLMLFAARTVAARSPRWLPQLAASIAAVALYFTARALFPFPGNEHQTDVAAFGSSIGHMLSLTLSAKGVVQNLLPALSVALLWLLAALRPARGGAESAFQRADIAAWIGLGVVAFAARIDYGVGRVMLYCFPLYLSAAFVALERLLADPRKG